MMRGLAAKGELGSGSHRAEALGLLVGSAVALGIGPLVHGSTLRDVGAFELYLASYILAPGVLFYRLVAGPNDDAITHLALGWISGILLSIAALVLLKVAGAGDLFPYVPLVLIPLLASLWRRGRGPCSTAIPTRSWHCAALSALLILAGLRAHMLPASNWWQGFDQDLYFHAGNAAELLHHWPMTDPRSAGAPLNYPFFAYVPAVGAGLVTHIPMAEIMSRLACGVGPILLGLVLFEAGRALGAKASVGLIAVFLILCHGDIAGELGLWFGRRWNVSSFLWLGLYDSPTTSFGLVFLAALVQFVQRWLESAPWNGARPALMAALVAFAVSGTKGSVMPVVILGSALCCVLQWVTERRLPRRALAVLSVLTIAAAPLSLLLVAGQASFASAMFRFLPLSAMYASGFSYNIGVGLGFDGFDPPLWLMLALFPVWLCLYLGPTAVGLALLARARRTRWGAFEAWLLSIGIVGMLLGIAVAAPGYSQLFFAYSGQLAMGLLAALGFAHVHPRLASGSGLVLALLVAISLISVVPGARQLEANLERGSIPESMDAQYLAGMTWLRRHAPDDAVLLTTHPTLQLSVHAERRVFSESLRFRPESHRLSWKERKGRWMIAWTEAPLDPRLKLVRTFADEPTAETFRPIRAEVPDAQACYLIVEDAALVKTPRQPDRMVLQPLAEEDPRARPPILRLEFGNPALRIYRIVDS